MRVLRQVGLIILICLICEGISSILPFPFPGSVLAMLVMLALFGAKIIKPSQIKETSDFLLGHMMLVFLPSFVSIVNYFDVLKLIWVKFAIIIIVSTVVTFFVAGTVVTLVTALQERVNSEKEGENNV